ncbi:MAG: hypothetical protein AB7G47_04990 [Mycolicibacterium sp.]|uniref:hypothetical protein n=1 Tax=Mycolicibacterium sp. TaxID=2320850 RepID=UPI003D0FE4A0
MAALIHKSAKIGALGLGAVAFSLAAFTLGAGSAGANPNNPNDPGMYEVGGDGAVSSRQAASTSSPKYCEVGMGTLGTASTPGRSEIGTPTQYAESAGPSWVGSDGWQAIGITGSNPWGGSFNPQNTRTGPQCRQGNASPF